jgi:hypothetical protein
VLDQDHAGDVGALRVFAGQIYVSQRHDDEGAAGDERTSSRVASSPWEQTSWLRAHDGVAAGASPRREAGIWTHCGARLGKRGPGTLPSRRDVKMLRRCRLGWGTIRGTIHLSARSRLP